MFVPESLVKVEPNHHDQGIQLWKKLAFYHSLFQLCCSFINELVETKLGIKKKPKTTQNIRLLRKFCTKKINFHLFITLFKTIKNQQQYIHH